MIYVGGNDGMLHAFDASSDATTGLPTTNAGHEVFAYVPGAVSVTAARRAGIAQSQAVASRHAMPVCKNQIAPDLAPAMDVCPALRPPAGRSRRRRHDGRVTADLRNGLVRTRWQWIQSLP